MNYSIKQMGLPTGFIKLSCSPQKLPQEKNPLCNLYFKLIQYEVPDIVFSV